MKRHLILILIFVFCTSFSFAQQKMYVNLHYVTVKSEDAQAHIDSEKEYFSKGHKAAIDNGNKIGWDMWRIENPGYRENHTTFVYAHLQDPDKAPNMGGGNGDSFSENELKMVREKWGERVVKSGFTTVSYKGGFVPSADQEPAKFAVLDWMMVDPIDFYAYEQMELKTFLPMQKSNKSVKGWGLHKVISPSNNNIEAADYVVARFFDSMSDIYNMIDQTNPMSKSMRATMTKITDLRTIKRSQVLRLILSER
tara:strand:- start:1214 stop:1972 length:759 start_codon:yes stop_codon:yes gene_type:complete